MPKFSNALILLAGTIILGALGGAIAVAYKANEMLKGFAIGVIAIAALVLFVTALADFVKQWRERGDY